MKWKIIVLSLLVCGALFAWIVTGRDKIDESLLLREIPVESAEQQRELANLADKVLELHRTRGERALKRIFAYGDQELMMIQAESGTNPYRQSIDLLNSHRDAKQVSEPQAVTFAGNRSSRYFVDAKLGENGTPVRFEFIKTKDAYRFGGVRTI
ncbi:MAG: hypothetical protein HPZ91_03540 [Lentisphaeria bacterium]|nr:hypothetical protein [Lentisphaeria bacterium]